MFAENGMELRPRMTTPHRMTRSPRVPSR